MNYISIRNRHSFCGLRSVAVALQAVAIGLCVGLCISCGTPEPPVSVPAAAEPLVDGPWQLLHQETFDTPLTLVDGQTFGEDGWLTANLRGAGASIVVERGAARLVSENFSDSVLIRLTEQLPAEYRLSVKVGRMAYEKQHYEHPEDFDDPAFKYKWPDYIENGFYWLTISSRLISPDSGEEFWHRYRKAVIDSNDHVGVERGTYFIYMDPDPHPNYDRDKDEPRWVNGVPGLLKCWDGKVWQTGKWNWEVAFTYEPDAWYHVEIEKNDGHLIMRAYDADGTLLPGLETTPVPLDDIFGMGENASEEEWGYIGEPHVDSYEGSACLDDIQLWLKR